VEGHRIGEAEVEVQQEREQADLECKVVAVVERTWKPAGNHSTNAAAAPPGLGSIPSPGSSRHLRIIRCIH
jgi:hypothetical protein